MQSTQSSQGWMDWISSFFYSDETITFSKQTSFNQNSNQNSKPQGIMNIYCAPEFQSRLQKQREKMDQIVVTSNPITSISTPFVTPHETLKRQHHHPNIVSHQGDLLKEMKNRTDQIRKSIENSD